jgi:radical SAM protein with 4Fe4S-binding SPASM domain
VKPYQAFFHIFFRDLEPGPFPFKLVVEVTNRCNLRCTTCPREVSGRGYGDMDEALFESLAEQASGRPLLFYPQGFGESLMHPRYPQLLEILRRKHVRYPIVITNGTLLDDEACAMLVDGPPKVVVVSLDGGEKDVYEDIRVNARFDQVVANVERLLALREERGSRHPFVVLSVIGTDTVQPTLPALEAHWRPLMRRTDDIFVCTPITWAGTWGTPSTSVARGESPPPGSPAAGEQPKGPCRLLYKTLTVYHDGKVTPCTSDHRCQLQIGNAKEQSLEEIWNGEPLARLRRLHEEGRSDEIDLCRGCPEHMP